MKYVWGIAVILVLGLLLSACPMDGSSKLRADLGPYQYLGLDPQLSFVVQKAEFAPAEDKYSAPTLNYTVNIRQNNGEFPLQKYGVAVVGSIQKANGTEVDTMRFSGEVENGVLSVSDIDKLYGSKVGQLPAAEVSLLKLKIKSYNWAPDIEQRPYVVRAENG
jgi:hypothetical protein